MPNLSKLPRMPGVTAWAIRREWLDNIRAGYAAAFDPARLAITFDESDRALNAAGIEMLGDIAVINISGAISRYDDFWNWYFGGSSVEGIDSALAAALESPRVSGILLRVNSPGGVADGISELAGKIKVASKAKPLVAYVDGDSCSAAYWLTSAAPKIVVNNIGWVGSVGAYYSFLDTKKADAMEGLREIKIISSQSPKKVLDPATKEGEEAYQIQVDDLAQVFIEDVARNRGTTVENVLSNYGQGDVMIGTKAVALGMADKVGTLETAIAELGRKISNTTGGFKAMTKEEILAQHPEAAKALMADGAAAERERIRGVKSIEAGEDQEVVNAAMFDGVSTAADVALKVLNAQKARKASMKDARAEDGNELAKQAAALAADKGADAHTEDQKRASLAALIAGKKEGN